MTTIQRVRRLAERLDELGVGLQFAIGGAMRGGGLGQWQEFLSDASDEELGTLETGLDSFERQASRRYVRLDGRILTLDQRERFDALERARLQRLLKS